MRNKTFDKLMDSIKELHDAKNNDYAKDGNPYSNFEFAALLVKEFTDPTDQVFAGIIGIKLARLGNLLGTGKEIRNESVEDTLRDLTTYCGIWTAWRMDRITERKVVMAPGITWRGTPDRSAERNELEEAKIKYDAISKMKKDMTEEIQNRIDKFYNITSSHKSEHSPDQ